MVVCFDCVREEEKKGTITHINPPYIGNINFKPLYWIEEILRDYPYIPSFGNGFVYFSVRCMYSNGFKLKFSNSVLTASASRHGEGDNLKGLKDINKNVKKEVVSL